MKTKLNEHFWDGEDDPTVGELFQSPDGDRIILYQAEDQIIDWTGFLQDEIDLGDGDFDFLFYNWIRVGEL